MPIKFSNDLSREMIEEITGACHTNAFIDLLGLEIMEVGPGFCKVALTVQPDHTNPYRTLHGGVTATMADTTMGLAARSLGVKIVTVNLNTTYIHPGAIGKEVVASGRVIHRGHTLVQTECTVYQDQLLIANAQGVFFVVG